MTHSDMQDISGLSAEDYRKAFVEVSFLMNAFAFTIDNIMGGNTAPVGRIAGRDTAGKLPLELKDPDVGTVIATLAGHEQFEAGFEIALEGDELRFGRCVIREMCAVRDHEPGGPLCKLFHSYFDGIVNGLISRPVKSTFVEVGAECRLRTAVQ